MKYLIALFILAILPACQFEMDQTIEYRIDPELSSYVDSFYFEAEKRNVYIPKDNLIVCFADHIDNNLAVNNNSGSQIKVTVDRQDYNWIINNWGHDAVENLIFHELGHGLLKRSHNDPNESIMASGLSLQAYINNPEKRKILVDELFNPMD